LLLKVVKTKVDTLVSCMPEASILTVPLSDVLLPLLLMPGVTSTSVRLTSLVWFSDELTLHGLSVERDFAERDV
jgi:hypothetical protein